MIKFHAGVVDTSGIQAYLSRNAELKEIARASNEVANLEGIFRNIAENSEVRTLHAYAGNMVVIGDSPKAICEVFRKITRRLLEYGQGLEAVCALGEGNSSGLAVVDAWRNLAVRKRTAPRSAVFTPPGCQRPEPLNPAWFPLGGKTESDELWEEPAEFKKLFGTEPKRRFQQMAVVKIDGIGVGGKLLTWLEENQTLLSVEFEAKYQALTKVIHETWEDAWTTTLEKTKEAFLLDEETSSFILQSRGRTLTLQKDDKGTTYLPCRRIYRGGDDLVFVADARVGLSLAACFANVLAEKKTPVAIGVAIVNSSFPFFKALELADRLRKIARKKGVEPESSALTWQVNLGGASEIEAPPHSLRPLTLNDWTNLEEYLVEKFDPVFRLSRGKLKTLMERLAQGRSAAQDFLDLTPPENAKDLNIDLYKPFDGEYTHLGDLGELFDFHLPFPKATAGDKST